MARRDKTAWLRQLQKSNVMDIQKRISEELADKIAREQKKESKFRNVASLLKGADAAMKRYSQRLKVQAKKYSKD